MPVVKLTVKAVDKLVAPDPTGKQVAHWDAELKGFGVLCSGVSNSKTYVAQRVLPDRRTRRVTVGAVSEIPLDKARQRAADALDDLRRGVDPKRKPHVSSRVSEFRAHLSTACAFLGFSTVARGADQS